MSDTPRTDARIESMSIENEDSCCAIYVKIDGKEYEGGLIDEDFTKDLERENAKLRSLLKRADGVIDERAVMLLAEIESALK